MTEAEWLACEDPLRMLETLRRTGSGRKLRLFAVAICRSVLALTPRSRLPDVVNVVEQHADGRATYREMGDAAKLSESLGWGTEGRDRALADAVWFATTMGLWYQLGRFRRTRRIVRLLLARNAQSPHQAAILRDIFGNPFRPVTFSPEWHTSMAVAIAQGMYESRDFDAMPILADALQDVGCDNADVLNHCRDEKSVHVRGCWVVDLVLGKE